ncbi:gluconokinase [uncultured Friedmanniella sp.]|uniref:gluconokinase n=1 Tax=uncultured Friedmanniella sp. TaxID=335381 RepID=UPI0035CA0809
MSLSEGSLSEGSLSEGSLGEGSLGEGASGEATGRTALVVMGVAGSGKTTVAELLAGSLGWTLAEADEFHSAANVARMAAGTPLTDADRAPWLASLRSWINAVDGDVVLTCSALRRCYRDVLRRADARVRFVHLDGTPATLAGRMAVRSGHFMPTTLLSSQLETLEPLEPDEDGVVVDIDGSPDQVAARAAAALGLP